MKSKNTEDGTHLLYIGIVLIVLSISFTLALNIQYPEASQTTTFTASMVSTAGIALVIIALIESKHLRKSLERTSNKIVKDSAENLDNKLKETFDIIEHSRYNGLIDILAPRLDEQEGAHGREIMANEIKKSKMVYIFGISGLDFFGYPRGGLPLAGESFNAIMERIDTAKKENKQLELEIKALLMDPTSEAAKFRDSIETFNGTKGNIDEDITIAKEGIRRLNEQAENKNFIEYCLYPIYPQIGFIITDSCAFIEPYHYAPTK